MGPVDQMGRQHRNEMDRQCGPGRAQRGEHKGRRIGKVRRLASDIATEEATCACVIGTRQGRGAGVGLPAMADRRQVVGKPLLVDDVSCVQPGNESLQRDEACDEPSKSPPARPCAKHCHGTKYRQRCVRPTPLFCFYTTRSDAPHPMREGKYEWEQPSPAIANKTSLAFTQFVRKLGRQTLTTDEAR
jgi:hypothetical protein